MNRETLRITKTLSLAMLLAGVSFSSCAEVPQEDMSVEAAGASAELNDSDKDGHDDYDDRWRFPGRRGDRHNRNICPLAIGIANPQTVVVGQSTKLVGFAIDFDGPRSLKYQWTAAPANLGTIANPKSKRTSFKCTKPGVVQLTFTANDGDCIRGNTIAVYCKPTTEQPKCGDGRLDPNETCDNGPGSTKPCPTSCDDNTACTTDTLTGTAAQCNVQCTHTPVTTCKTGDACCPSGCNVGNDAECTPQCGDGVVSAPGETCDNGAGSATKCPTSCNDNNACTTDTTMGSSNTCNVVCGHSNISACSGATLDGCCPTGCTNNTDKDCPVTGPVCGNGIVEAGEVCDSGVGSTKPCPTSCNDNSACTTDTLQNAGTCNASCVNAPVTACTANDGCCPATCTRAGGDLDCQVVGPVCNDGKVEAPETCDNGPGSPKPCPTTCNDGVACTTDVLTGTAAQCNVLCTNSAITTCSGNTVDTCCIANTCDANTDRDCPPVCGNGVIEADEVCDSGLGSTKPCPTACTDGNSCTTDTLQNAGTCKATCVFAPITVCKSGDMCCAPGCINPTNDLDCDPTPFCGNGAIDAGETCDNGPNSPKRCPTSCNDNNACTTDVLAGNANDCTATCTASPITACTAPTGDSCCPSACNANTDVDCIQTCGNNVKEGTELCDGPDCPTAATCNDNDPCTLDTITGSTATCDARCAHAPLTTPECLCGNGKLDQNETCDNGAGSTTLCPTSCNDNNACTTDTLTGAGTCQAKCTTTPVTTPECLCGNGAIDGGEKCDNGAGSPKTCPTTCAPGADLCNPLKLTGSATTCSAECVAVVNTTCSADGICCSAPQNPANVACSPVDPDCGPVKTICRACEEVEHDGNFNCPDATALCDNIPGVATAGSAAGTLKTVLCKAALDCVHDTHCAAPNSGGDVIPTDCLCGKDVSANDCFNTGKTFEQLTGACKNEFAAAAETTSVNDLGTRFFSPDYASGAAEAVVETCDAFFCQSECL